VKKAAPSSAVIAGRGSSITFPSLVTCAENAAAALSAKSTITTLSYRPRLSGSTPPDVRLPNDEIDPILMEVLGMADSRHASGGDDDAGYL
jgi:hypothetical protein